MSLDDIAKRPVRVTLGMLAAGVATVWGLHTAIVSSVVEQMGGLYELSVQAAEARLRATHAEETQQNRQALLDEAARLIDAHEERLHASGR